MAHFVWLEGHSRLTLTEFEEIVDQVQPARDWRVDGTRSKRSSGRKIELLTATRCCVVVKTAPMLRLVNEVIEIRLSWLMLRRSGLHHQAGHKRSGELRRCPGRGSSAGPGPEILARLGDGPLRDPRSASSTADEDSRHEGVDRRHPGSRAGGLLGRAQRTRPSGSTSSSVRSLSISPRSRAAAVGGGRRDRPRPLRSECPT